MQRTKIHKSEYASSLIEASLDPLFTISTEGKITDMNQATINVTGISREALTGTDFFIYFTDPQKAREVYEEVFAKGFVVDYPLVISDHKFTDVLFNGSIYKDEEGNILGAVVVARDITNQKKIEKELREAKVYAEDAKNKAEKAKRIAEDAVKAKQQFLSNMSHEIRTPLNAIIGFTKVVSRTPLSPKQKEYVTAIKMSGDALIVLINDILDLAKVDSGKMTFEETPFKMASSISGMLQSFETKIREKNITLEIEYDGSIPEVLVGDKLRLHQVILNLVSNAVKFTATGKITVGVRLLHLDVDTATVEFLVTDTGIGIAEDKIGKIFENFQQASSGTSRLYGGTGLGLAIVKHLVEAQGGHMYVISRITEGSTFGFILSFKRTDDDAEQEVGSAEPDAVVGNVKVLVVEDIALNQLLMKTILDDFGFDNDIAGNGKIAIEKMKHSSYDILLMDLQMPEMNGFEATEYIRNVMGSSVCIIALTADVTTVDLEKCKAVGMNDYITKPVDERLLYSKMVALLKKGIPFKTDHEATGEAEGSGQLKYINMDYLMHRTKSNSKLMMEMIGLYLDQTPSLITLITQSFRNQDWDTLQSAAHKIIPSFSIMGISSDFENMAKAIHEYAKNQKQAEGIKEMIFQLEAVCVQACKELEEELNKIKNQIR